MADEYEVFIEASVRGYHAYFNDVTVVIGEVLMCERELDNAYDKYAVAVSNEQGKVVGHVPIELSKVSTRFIRDYGEIEAECIGARYNRGEGKGLDFPVVYKLTGNKRCLEKLVSSIKKKETTCNLTFQKLGNVRVDIPKGLKHRKEKKQQTFSLCITVTVGLKNL